MAEDQESNRLKMHSPDLTEANIDKLAELFPDCVTEAEDDDGNLKRAIDFDQLRQELSDHIVQGPQERYRLDWPGKREALLAANAPIAKTLRPCREESVDFDTTKNLFIEGDNLDALKLLHETYLGKVKMIYIDPPYNIDGDRLYLDNYRQSEKNYLEISGQLDAENGKLVANTSYSGKFHSAWLSMMYPRLKLARNLLRPDGVICISIDDREFPNLRKICDGIFGLNNFCGVLKRRAARKTAHLSGTMSDLCDYIVIYRRSSESGMLSVSEASDDTRPVFNQGNSKSSRFIRRGTEARCDDGIYEAGRYAARSLEFEISSDLEIRDSRTINDVEVVGPWRINQEVLDKTVYFTRNFSLRRYVTKEEKGIAKAMSDLVDIPELYNEKGTEYLDSILSMKGVFQNPKPIGLLTYLMRACNVKTDDIVLDFFAGSGTTGDAVWHYTTSRPRFILVQIAEYLDNEDSATHQAIKFCEKENIATTISAISCRKLKLSIDKLKGKSELSKCVQDFGYRVFKTDSTNLKDVYYSPDVVTQDSLFGQIDNIKEGRTDEDLLFQILLDWGVDLSLPVQAEKIAGKTVYFVDENAVAACFEAGIDEDFVKQLAERKPLRAVFRDSGYGSDNTKINVEQIFKLISPSTEVKTI